MNGMGMLFYIEHQTKQVRAYASEYFRRKETGKRRLRAKTMALRRIAQLREWLDVLEEELRAEEYHQ